MSFSCRIRQCFGLWHVLFFQQTISHIRKRFTEWGYCVGRMNIMRVIIGFFTGFKKIKQRSISFVLGYLRMILWKISTAISIKHRILATFNMKKQINSDSLYAFKVMVFNVTFNNISVIDNMAVSFIGGGKRSCNVTNLCLGRATTRSHSSQWSKKKLQLKHKNSLFTLQTFHCNYYWWSQSLLNRFGWEIYAFQR